MDRVRPGKSTLVDPSNQSPIESEDCTVETAYQRVLAIRVPAHRVQVVDGAARQRADRGAVVRQHDSTLAYEQLVVTCGIPANCIECLSGRITDGRDGHAVILEEQSRASADQSV